MGAADPQGHCWGWGHHIGMGALCGIGLHWGHHVGLRTLL